MKRAMGTHALWMALVAGGVAGVSFGQDETGKIDLPGPEHVIDAALRAQVLSTFDANGAVDAADKEGVAAQSLERAHASWPFSISREEAARAEADDSAEAEMMVRLAARKVPLAPAHTPNYYYYRGQAVAMELDTSRIAIMLSEQVPVDMLVQTASDLARASGVMPKVSNHVQTGRWVLLDLAEPLKGYEDADAVLEQFAKTAGVVIASPVFHAPLLKDGYVTITPGIMARVNKPLEATKLNVLAQKAPTLTVTNPELGLIPGAVMLQSSAKNGFAVLAEANRLAQDPAFAWAEADLRGTAESDYVPNDPSYSLQWHHDNNGDQGGVADADMDTDLAWEYTRGISLIDTLILDEGTQPDHADLNWQAGRDFTTGVVGGIGNGAPTWACDNHGTPVAGTVAQLHNNGLLESGTAPRTNVLCAKVGDASIHNPPCSNSWDVQHSYIINAIAWGITNGADVSNSSFSLGSTSSGLTDAYNNSATSNGITHMGSSGNDSNSSINYPSSIAYVNAVGNMQRNNTRNSTSNYGTGITFSSPGTSIATIDREGSAGYTTGDDMYFGGTSAASPNAAGIAAIFKSAFPWATRSQTFSGMVSGCRELGASGYDTVYGYGFVNGYYEIINYNPSNDAPWIPTIIPAGTFTYSYVGLDTTWATDDWRDPQASCELNGSGEGSSVYYRFTAPNTGLLDINTNGSDYDTVLSVWDGPGSVTSGGLFDAPNNLGCDDDSGTGTQSQLLNIPLQIGQVVYIKVAAYGNYNPGGTMNIALNFDATPPANDSCASPTTIPGNAYGTFNPPILDTDNATVSTCENRDSCSNSGANNSNSVWYEFTPFEDGVITVDTEGSDYDTVVSIYSSACATFFPPSICLRSSSLACNDDGGTGLLSLISDFQVDQGVTYYIKVSDYGAEGGGSLDFNVDFSPPAVPSNDACSNATVMPGGAPGGNYSDEIRTHSAGTSICEPAETCEVGGAGSGHSVFYTFTPQCDGVIQFSTAGSDYDTVLSIWSNCRSLIALPSICTGATQLACDDDSGPGTTSQILGFDVSAGEDYLIRVASFGTGPGGRLTFNSQFMCTIPNTCDSIDFNNDGLFPDTLDIDDFLASFAGNPCSTGNCNDIDFNNDQLYPDTLDIDAFLSVFAGGPCL